MTKTVAAHISSLIRSIRNCQQSGNASWEAKHADRLDTIRRNHLPSGSGWDCGTEIVFDECTDSQLVFTGSFHVMNDVGMYTHWLDFRVTAHSTFDGIDVNVECLTADVDDDLDGLLDYLSEMFWCDLQREVTL